MTDEDVRELELAAQDFQKSTAEGDLVKMAEADVNFHEAIYRAADNKRLMQVLNNLREQIYRYRVEYLKEDEARNRLVKEHEEITDAIRNRDVKKAQELSFEHLENQRMGIIQAIRAEEVNRILELGDTGRDTWCLFFIVVQQILGNYHNDLQDIHILRLCRLS